MERVPVYVTTSLKGEVSLKDEAKAWADEVGAYFVPRQGRGEEELHNLYEDLIIYTNMGPEIRTEGGRHQASPLLARVTAWGFSRYVHERRAVTEALRHIHLTYNTYESVLTSIKDKSYDIIYFDPMFTRPVQESSNFTPLRDVVCHVPLTTDMIDLALCKARKRVVIKGRDFSELSGKYDNLKVGGGRYSRISYAVLECSRK